MRKEFEQFMKQNGWWETFIRNLKKDIDNFFNENDPCDYIVAAFVFSESPEGRDFWESVQSRWDKYYKSLR